MTTGVRRLSLLASAVAGRLLDVTGADPGTPTWTDGATVFVDESLAPDQQAIGVVVQATLVGAGSLSRDVVAALARRASLVPRYLAVEAHRALAGTEELLPPALVALVDHTMARRSDSASTSLVIAAGREPLVAPPPVFGTILARRVRADGGTADAGAGAGHVPRPSMPATLRELEDDPDAGSPDEAASDMFSPVDGGGPLGRMLKRLLLRDTRSGNAGPAGAEGPTRFSRRAGRAAGAAAFASAIAAADQAALVRARGWTYPEWDLHRRAYRGDWCTVSELDADLADVATVRVPDTHALRRAVARVGLDVERRRRQPRGDDIDIDAVVAGRVDLAAGSVPDELFYVDNVRRRRDLAVLVLLDVSGSAGQPSVTGAAVHEHQRAAAAALVTALHGIGDRVALHAFRSMGRQSVQLTPVKRFGDAAGAVMLRRLSALVPGAYTRLGAAIRHGAAVLEADGGTGRRLLVVVSDGFAYDHGYEGAYGEADARRALAEARRRGTGCVCLSIGAASDPDALRRVFGTAAHASVPRLEQLPGVVGPLFRAALRSAEAQRRSWQRSERTRERLAMDRRTA